MRTVAVSGGFDPLHSGHVELLEHARRLGDRLVVILNNDNWLRDKKGFAFMDQNERARVLRAMRCVDKVVITKHKPKQKDTSVCRELELLRPTIFANGGDRKAGNIPEYDLCERLGIDMRFEIGGDKTQSSSWLLEKVRTLGITEERPWGWFTIHAQQPHFWIKTICMRHGGRTSLQSHENRSEVWVCIKGRIEATKGEELRILTPGDTLTIERGEVHRLSSKGGGTIVEIALGRPKESDIKRIQDDYGRS